MSEAVLKNLKLKKEGKPEHGCGFVVASILTVIPHSHGAGGPDARKLERMGLSDRRGRGTVKVKSHQDASNLELNTVS